MRTIRLQAGTGEIEVVELGGRVAGLYPEPTNTNLLWRGDTAPVAGGDRLWLSPEREVIYDGDPWRRENWRCPEELDPGSWVLDAGDDRVTLRQDALGARMQRTIRPLSGLPVATDLPWSGCEVEDEVAIDRDWSGWHLAMVPAPAWLYARASGDPIALYGELPELDEGGWYRAAGQRESKIGLLPPDDGRVVMAAVGDGDPGPLVVLQTHADPKGTYRDRPPWVEGPETALQLYDSPQLGFCEMEHHFPLEATAVTTTLVGAFGSHAARLELLDRLVASTAGG